MCDYLMLVTTCGIAVADIIAADLPSIASPGEAVFGRRGTELHVGGHPLNVSIDARAHSNAGWGLSYWQSDDMDPNGPAHGGRNPLCTSLREEE